MMAEVVATPGDRGASTLEIRRSLRAIAKELAKLGYTILGGKSNGAESIKRMLA